MILIMHLAMNSLSHRKPTCQSSAQRQPATVWRLLWESDRTCWIIEKLLVPRAGMLSLLTVIICGEVVNNAHSFNQQPTTSNNCGDLFPRWNAKWSGNQFYSLHFYFIVCLNISNTYLPFNVECCFSKLQKGGEPVWEPLWLGYELTCKLISGACWGLNP